MHWGGHPNFQGPSLLSPWKEELNPGCRHAPRKAFKEFGCQDHCFDLDETISMLSHLSIAEVEGYAPLYENTTTTRTLLDTYHMTMPTGHFAIDPVDDNPDRCLEIARELGIKHVIVPFLQPDQRPSDASGWREPGARVASMGKPIRDAGLGYGWHNHEFEFLALPDGTLPIEHLTEASPEIDLELEHDNPSDPERFARRSLATVNGL